ELAYILNSLLAVSRFSNNIDIALGLQPDANALTGKWFVVRYKRADRGSRIRRHHHKRARTTISDASSIHQYYDSGYGLISSIRLRTASRLEKLKLTSRITRSTPIASNSLNCSFVG